MTIKQLLDCKEPYPGGELELDGRQITQVTFVGQVRSVNPQATNVTYRIDDGTGIVDVKKWVDPDKLDADGSGETPFALDAYVRVMGRLNSFNNKRHVGAHVIRPVTDFNEVNYHLLEATYVHLLLTRGDPQQGAQQQGRQQGAAGGNAGDGDSMFVDGGGYGTANEIQVKVAACSRTAQRLYNWMAHSPGGNEGLHINVMASGTGLSLREVMSAIEELSTQGVVYCTLDDETFAVL